MSRRTEPPTDPPEDPHAARVERLSETLFERLDSGDPDECAAFAAYCMDRKLVVVGDWIADRLADHDFDADARNEAEARAFDGE